MDDTVVVEFMDRSEVRSEGLGEKRALENGLDRDLGIKKVKGGGEDVRLARCVKKVAEIVLVLATMGKMRAGRKPTEVEMQMMAEAREKLADVCKEFAPKDIFPRDAFGTVIEDLGLNGLREHKLGIRSQKLSIAEKLQVTKQKMEKSDVFPLHSNTYTPPRLHSNASGAMESRGTSNAVRMFPSDKANHASVSSGSFQNPSNVVHTSATNSRALPYQLPTSEVRPGVANLIHTGRDSSSLPVSRAERPHFRIDGGANGSPYTSQSQGKTPTWSMQSQSAHSSVKTEGSDLTTARVANQAITSKPFITQVTPNPTTHNEVSKIVQKILHPNLLNHPTWTPPSRDYMNKALTCQTCKVTINDVDNALVCDACERGYHLRCIQCNPKAIIPRGEWQEWHCGKCLAISNGKPLPPKYGRVMRNISTPKLSLNSGVGQPSLDKKMESLDGNVVDQKMMSTNGGSFSQSASGGYVGNDSESTETPLNENQECETDNLVERSNQEKFTIVSESQPPANSEAITSLPSHLIENHHDDNHTIKEDEPAKTSETRIVIDEHVGPSSSSMREVEWVGGVLKEIDGKTYYESCCIKGTVYKVKDYALFSSHGDKCLPNKLQAMWEDGKTTKKWVTVTRCFFPDDLPEGVGRPCAPESNEVYESNHESILPAGLIHDPCEVLPPSKFSEETVVRTRLRARGSDRPKSLFLCKWFYDETKRLFRDVTC